MNRIILLTNRENRSGAIVLVELDKVLIFRSDNDMQYIAVKVYQDAFNICGKNKKDKMELFSRKVREIFFNLD